MITAHAETMVACADMDCMCRHDHCYLGIFTPGLAYVHADIVIETHGAPYRGASWYNYSLHYIILLHCILHHKPVYTLCNVDKVGKALVM